MPGIAKKRSAKLKRQWKKIIGDCQESKKSIRAFCRERGISERGYYYWNKKLNLTKPVWSEIRTEIESEESEPDAISSLFLPLQVAQEQEKNLEPENYIVELKSGHKILVPVSIGLDSLINLVAALENEKC